MSEDTQLRLLAWMRTALWPVLGVQSVLSFAAAYRFGSRPRSVALFVLVSLGWLITVGLLPTVPATWLALLFLPLGAWALGALIAMPLRGSLPSQADVGRSPESPHGKLLSSAGRAPQPPTKRRMTGFLQAVTLFIIAGLALMTVFTVPRSHRKAATPLIVGCWALVAVFACWQLYLHWFNNLSSEGQRTVASADRATDGTLLLAHLPPQPRSHVNVRIDREGDRPVGYTDDWIKNEEATMAAGALCALLTIAYGAYRLRHPKK